LDKQWIVQQEEEISELKEIAIEAIQSGAKYHHNDK
jgi:hypothetical protein